MASIEPKIEPEVIVVYGFPTDEELDKMMDAQKQKWRERLKREGKDEDSESYETSPEGNARIELYVPKTKKCQVEQPAK